MEHKWIVFYISSHGFGHMTRCLAIMEEILEKTNYHIYIASGKFQNDFARIYLAPYADRLILKDIVTDIGLINFPNSLKVDVDKLESTLSDFVASWEEVVDREYEFLRKFKIQCVISDISPIGVLVGEKLKVRNIGISNFTWVEQYRALGIQIDIIERFKKAYSKLNYFIEYDLALPMDSLKIPKKKIGFISRKIDRNKVKEIKEKYGESIFITCGKSANLDSIGIENYNGCIFTTSGIDIAGNSKVIQLPIDTLDTQNYIAASTIVFAKAGWGTIAEALIARRRLVLIEREGVLEDTHNITELKNRKVAISIKERDLKHLDMECIKQEINNKIAMEKLDEYRNEKSNIMKSLELDIIDEKEKRYN